MIEERKVKTFARVWMVMLLSFCFFVARAQAQTNVVTFHNDAARTGVNSNEALLSPGNVNSTQFGKLFSYPVDGFIVGQPLIMSNVTIPGLGVHNVVYVGTMNDTIYAFDADSNLGSNTAPLWSVSFANPAADITPVPIAYLSCTQTTGFTQMGIEGTPVIDPNTGTLYVIVKTLENDTTIVDRIHALDITTGAEKFGGPVVVGGSVTGLGGTVVPFIDQKQMTRPAMLLSNGVLTVAFGTLGCNGGGVHGWLMSYDATSLQQLGIFCTTPNVGGGAGFWQSGGGPAEDADGNIYIQTADGTFDENTGGGDYGDSLLKVSLQSTGLFLNDYFAPYDQATLKAMDEDLGSGGVLVLPDQPGLYPHLAVGGGKEGTLYLLNRDNLGQYCNGCTSDPQIIQEITGFGSIHSTAAFWNNMVFAAGGKGVTSYSLQNGFLTPVTSTSKLGSLSSPVISADGLSNGIVWVMNNNILYAFNATNLASQLYNSQKAGNRDALDANAHFGPVTEANGKVYVGTTTQLVVFGLFPGLTPYSGNNQTGAAKSALPLSIEVQALNQYTGTPYIGVTVTFSDAGKGGTFSSTTATTDSNGFASTIYTLPKRALAYTITASSPGISSALFTETAVPASPSRLGIVSGNAQTEPVSTRLDLPLITSVLDAYGNAISGYTVNYSDGGAGGSFSATSAITNTQGRASVTYTTPPAPGTVKVTASATGLANAVFTEFVTAPQ
jgi:PQQ-like domain